MASILHRLAHARVACAARSSTWQASSPSLLWGTYVAACCACSSAALQLPWWQHNCVCRRWVHVAICLAVGGRRVSVQRLPFLLGLLMAEQQLVVDSVAALGRTSVLRLLDTGIAASLAARRTA